MSNFSFVPENAACKNCIYSTALKGNLYSCRFNPPVILPVPGNIPGSINMGSFFPTVKDSDYCSKFYGS